MKNIISAVVFIFISACSNHNADIDVKKYMVADDLFPKVFKHEVNGISISPTERISKTIDGCNKHVMSIRSSNTREIPDTRIICSNDSALTVSINGGAPRIILEKSGKWQTTANELNVDSSDENFISTEVIESCHIEDSYSKKIFEKIRSVLEIECKRGSGLTNYRFVEGLGITEVGVNGSWLTRLKSISGIKREPSEL